MLGFIKGVGKAIIQGGREIFRRAPGVLSWLRNGVFWYYRRLLKWPELILSMAGWRVRKKLRLKVIILPDKNNKPLVTHEQVEYVVSAARTAFREAANIRIVSPKDTDMIETFTGTAPEWVSSVKCNGGGFRQSFGRVGRWFRTHAYKKRGVTIFVVWNIQGKNGCFLGTADYGLIDLEALPEPGKTLNLGVALTLAHELGHGCDLFHSRGVNNLMRRTGVTRTGRLTHWQVAVIRSSRLVQYL
jgi:hypothetical protein